MLNKEIMPSIEEMENVIGNDRVQIFEELDEFLRNSYEIISEIRFPFGNHYGWGVKYSHKTKHLCYVFPEAGAFTVTIQIGGKEVQKLLDNLDALLPKTRENWEKRYPCGSGGWMHYKILSEKELNDVKELIRIKKKPNFQGGELKCQRKMY